MKQKSYRNRPYRVPATAVNNSNTPERIFAGIKPIITEEVVKQMNDSFLFELSGSKNIFILVNAGCLISRSMWYLIVR